MASTEDNRNLSIETAEALLTAIKLAAPTAQNRSSEGLKVLSEAYAAVVGAMAKPQGKARSVVTG